MKDLVNSLSNKCFSHRRGEITVVGGSLHRKEKDGDTRSIIAAVRGTGCPSFVQRWIRRSVIYRVPRGMCDHTRVDQPQDFSKWTLQQSYFGQRGHDHGRNRDLVHGAFPAPDLGSNIYTNISQHFIGNRAIDLASGEAELQIAYSSGFTALSFFVPILVLLAAFVSLSLERFDRS